MPDNQTVFRHAEKQVHYKKQSFFLLSPSVERIKRFWINGLANVTSGSRYDDKSCCFVKATAS